MPAPALRILIVDDEPERSRDWAAKIESFGFPGATVTALDIEGARVVMKAADARRRRARENLDPIAADAPCDLDTVDVLIVDYDLQELLRVGEWSTGLQVATLARALTRVKLIVLVNQFGTNSFDLTLSKAAQSHADFDVGSGQLLNPAFWDRARIGGYAPWGWNDGVLRAPARLSSMVEWLMPRLDDPVLTSLGFTAGTDDSNADTYLTNELWQEFLIDPGHSFRHLVSESEFLTLKDRQAISTFDEPCARVAAALVSHWLDRWVIPANDVLIDLPHLASSYPWLLTKREEVRCWQHAASLDSGFDAFLPDVANHQFTPGFPLSRSVVWRRKIVQDGALAEPNGFTYDGFPDLVFCEDTSKFHEFCESRPFSCRLPGNDPQRFVADPEKVVPTSGGQSLTDVVYEPSVFFAL